MHKKLIEELNDIELKETMYCIFEMIKSTNYDLYEELEEYLYEKVYGCHFNEWLSKKAVEELHNEDGTNGSHWTYDQAISIAKQYNVSFTSFNEYDWYYVINMIYSDYYGAISNEASAYVKFAKRFLEDKDAPEGKAFKYYMAMK